MFRTALLSTILASAVPYSVEQHCNGITIALERIKFQNPYFFQSAYKEHNEFIDHLIENVNQMAKTDTPIQFYSKAIPFVIDEISLQGLVHFSIPTSTGKNFVEMLRIIRKEGDRALARLNQDKKNLAKKKAESVESNK